VTNLLTLANNAGEITRRGTEHKKDSVIDLAWYNEAAIWAATFTGLHLDWASSLGLDHTMLQVAGHPCGAIALTTTESNLGFLIDPEKREEWMKAFKAKTSAPPLQLSPTIDKIEEAATTLTNDIHQTNAEILKKCQLHHPKASPW
jgi:hypothetical protein